MGRLAELGAEGVTAMVCDSTNAMREGRSPSERDIAASLAEIIAQAKRRVVVTIFASRREARRPSITNWLGPRLTTVEPNTRRSCGRPLRGPLACSTPTL